MSERLTAGRVTASASPRYQLGPILERMGACSDARGWLREAAHPSAASAWAAFPRGDHMLWLATAAGVDRRLVVLAACDCAEPALVYVPADEHRPRIAIKTARQWARGRASIAGVRAAARATASASAAAARATWSACAAALAACAAADEEWVAAAAAREAAAAAREAAAAARAAAMAALWTAREGAALWTAREEAAARASLAHSADLVRARIPYATVEAALLGYARDHGCLIEIGGGR